MVTVYKLCRVVDHVFRSFNTSEPGFDLVYKLHEYTTPANGPVWVFDNTDAAVAFIRKFMCRATRYVLLSGMAYDVALRRPVCALSLRDYYGGTCPLSYGDCCYPVASRFMPTDVVCEVCRYNAVPMQRRHV